MAGDQGKQQWGSRLGFLMAAIGSAVGLGNLWRFPFQAGENGGGAFVLIYIACVFLIGYPVLMAELAIGRHKGLSAVGSTRDLAIDAGRSPKWQIAGWIGLLVVVMVLPSYSMISGQIMAYSVMGFMGDLSDPNVTPLYGGVVSSLLWFTAFLALTAGIVLRGLKRGIELASVFLMPAFFFILLGLAAFALLSGAAGDALSYLFRPRFDQLTADVVLAALGQALFSLGVGAGLMITFGSFLSKEVRIGSNARIIASADTLTALVAGLMIFPIVFAFGMDPAAGMGLIFGALPSFFMGMPFGNLIGGLFFFLAFVAALTSSISLLLISRTIGVEQFGLSERNATILFTILAWIGGVGIIFIDGFGSLLDWLVGSVALPLGALTAALIAGWVSPQPVMRAELSHTSDWSFDLWRGLIRYVVPVAIIVILFAGLTA
ncbi:Sodium-dependent neutral amino acid transporter B(0)AT2 [Altererythrobacter insulae]|nr:Sodium-dependent neutral amino acid transporter B(0)AT2 [Altererythrobacter insulae]